MCVSRSYRSLSVFRDHLIQHYSCTLFELSFVYPPCLLCPSPDQHRVLMVAKSHVTHSLAFRIIGSAPLFCESGSACRCTIVFHHEVGASGRSKLSSLPSRNIPSRSCFFRIYRSTLGDSAPPFNSIRVLSGVGEPTSTSQSQLIMLPNQHGSTTSLEKTTDLAQHMEDGGLETAPGRPEALKTMNDSDMVLLEKKLVRKMDCIIL